MRSLLTVTFEGSLIYLIYAGLIITCIIKFFLKLAHKGDIRRRLENNRFDMINKYYQILISHPELCKLRAKYNFATFIAGILIVIGLILLIVCFYLSIPFFILSSIILFTNNGSEYRKIYKNSIITAALKEFDSNIYYAPECGVYKSEYYEGFKEIIDRFTSEDYIFGNFDGLEFKIADVRIEQKYKDRDGHEYYVTSYHGPFGKFYLNKAIDFSIIIRHNTPDELINFKDSNELSIDNPEFDKLYDVYTNNDMKAMMLLTPALTSKLVDLYNTTGVGFDMNIVRNKVFLKFKTQELFKAYPDNPMKEAYGVALYFDILEGIKGIMTEMANSLKKMND